MSYEIINSDCLRAMQEMQDGCVDAIVTDPPYGLAFMGANWDHNVPSVAYWSECLRVAKSGAHLLCFGGTRTFHRLMCAIEDAGWEIRDCIMWVTGQGFPKSMDVSKAIEKKHGADAAAQWDGWGTCLKPAWEPIIVARKPLDGTVAHNVMTYGTGAINIDGCRVPTEEFIMTNGVSKEVQDRQGIYGSYGEKKTGQTAGQKLGRFPANLVHDGSQEVLELFPDTNPSRKGRPRSGRNGMGWGMTHTGAEYDDAGSAARFFYCAKASKKDRNSGCEDLLTWEHDQELTRLLEQSSQLLKDISECTTLSQGAERCSTSLFGNSTMGLSQTECRFITSTVIKLTTESKTCDSSQRLSINESILDAIRTSEESGISLARLADKLRSLRLDSTKEETDSAINAVSALFDALSEIRNCARKGNLHPTVKPNALMRWLVRLVCPQGGTVLDPFMGSGSTGVACIQEGMRFVGIEMDEHYCEIAEKRIGAEPDTVFD